MNCGPVNGVSVVVQQKGIGHFVCCELKSKFFDQWFGLVVNCIFLFLLAIGKFFYTVFILTKATNTHWPPLHC